ncbi:MULTISPECIES: hypothetical protein [unclassified Serratia (in: enterobacteria)]|uniref:hypothetical protein n=1 Tax=unclassified Serratia (in: enterobacteria) TaxID=2647522 RepID=UPI002ED4B470|nr:hypothetical protein [Serratia sp. C2(2)]MEE4445195.1 hypothetical protein [Serratia sp. C2(1)]
MKSPMTYTALRVKKFGAVPVVELLCVDTKSKQETKCLFLQASASKPVILGAELFHPLMRAELTAVAEEALRVGIGKDQIEDQQRIAEMESSRKRQASRAKQFKETIEGWAEEISSLNVDVRNGLDTPTIRTRLSTVAKSMHDFNPKK